MAQPFLVVDLVQAEVGDESAAISNVFCCVDVLHCQPPEAADEVCDDEDDHHQAEDFVRVDYYILRLRPICPLALLVITLDQRLDSVDIHQVNELGEPGQPDHLGVHLVVQQVEGKRSDEVHEHPPFHILHGYLVRIANQL